MENSDLMFCQHKTAHLLDSKYSMQVCSPPHHTPVGLQFLLSIRWGGQWLCTWIICKKQKENVWLLAAFSSVTGLDTDLLCDSEGLHGSHTAWPCSTTGKQALSCARIVHLPRHRHQILIKPHTMSPHEKEARTEGSWLAQENAALSILNARKSNAGLPGRWYSCFSFSANLSSQFRVSF